MMLLLLLQVTIATPDFRAVDPSLEPYSLQQVGDAYQEMLDEEGSTQEKMWFRALGWLQYAACATAFASVQYRQDRSNWTPALGPWERAGAYGGGAQAMNMGSEWLADGSGELGIASRIGGLIACGWAAGYNFNRGWFRE